MVVKSTCLNNMYHYRYQERTPNKFNESVVHDNDEYEDHKLDNSENEDNGIVLDIMGCEYAIRRKDL